MVPKLGDVVYLKSGGLPMTVFDYDSTEAKCVWHDRNGTQHVSVILFVCLTDEPENP